MNSLLQYSNFIRLPIPLLLVFVFLTFTVRVNGQEKPPKPIIVTVSTAQHLQFGSFIQTGNLGTVTVDYNGIRSATGNVLLPNIHSIVSPALFIVESHPGTLVTILNGPTVELIGNHGGKMTLTLGEASTRSPFVTRSHFTDVFIGGTLTVGPLSANPAGSYSGTFTVTFIQE